MLDPIDVFRARCEARALLWQAGEFGDPDDARSLHTAVDELLAASLRLLPAVSIGTSQAVMAIAFDAVRDGD